MTRYAAIAILVIALCSCEKDVEFNITGQAPVVVNALFNPDSTWRMRVDKAWRADEPSIYFDTIYIDGMPVIQGHTFKKAIEDARIEITSDGGEHITLDYDSNGYYISPLKPRAGESYHLSVNVPGRPVVSSSVVLPNPVPVDTAYIAVLPSSELLLTIEFTDAPGPTTYEFAVWSGTNTPYVPNLKCDDPDVHVELYFTPLKKFEDNGASAGPWFLSLGDWNFKGQKKKLLIRTYGDPNEEWTVRMRTLSDEFARYRATSQLQQSTKNDPFAEPIQVFNNISQGVGIFAGYSLVDYKF